MKARGVNRTTGKPQNQLTWGHRGLQKMNLKPDSFHGTDLGHLCIYFNCVAWSSCAKSNSGSRSCIWLCYVLLGFSSSTGLPLPASKGKEMPSLTANLYTMADWYLGKACPIQKRKEEEWKNGEDFGGSIGRRGVRKRWETVIRLQKLIN